ncbi:hypothetical protein M8494_27340 [Serratia ureilytica]
MTVRTGRGRAGATAGAAAEMDHQFTAAVSGAERGATAATNTEFRVFMMSKRHVIGLLATTSLLAGA